MQQLEHPFYSLSPVTSVREYHHGNHWLHITPSVAGLATIYDKDILIYAISRIMSAQNNGQEISPSVRINAHAFLIFTNRGTGGKDYQALIEALERLRPAPRTRRNRRLARQEYTTSCYATASARFCQRPPEHFVRQGIDELGSSGFVGQWAQRHSISALWACRAGGAFRPCHRLSTPPEGATRPSL